MAAPAPRLPTPTGRAVAGASASAARRAAPVLVPHLSHARCRRRRTRVSSVAGAPLAHRRLCAVPTTGSAAATVPTTCACRGATAAWAGAAHATRLWVPAAARAEGRRAAGHRSVRRCRVVRHGTGQQAGAGAVAPAPATLLSGPHARVAATGAATARRRGRRHPPTSARRGSALLCITAPKAATPAATVHAAVVVRARWSRRRVVSGVREARGVVYLGSRQRTARRRKQSCVAESLHGEVTIPWLCHLPVLWRSVTMGGEAKTALRVVAGVLPKLEPLLASELRSLGVTGSLQSFRGGVEFRATQALLWRVAHEARMVEFLRVRVCNRGFARNWGELYHRVVTSPWSAFMTRGKKGRCPRCDVPGCARRVVPCRASAAAACCDAAPHTHACSHLVMRGLHVWQFVASQRVRVVRRRVRPVPRGGGA